jgi:hypothetical protein
MDNFQQVGIVPEAHPGEFHKAFALNEDLIVAVDQNIRDRVISYQGLQGPESEDFEFQFLGQAGPFLGI